MFTTKHRTIETAGRSRVLGATGGLSIAALAMLVAGCGGSTTSSSARATTTAPTSAATASRTTAPPPTSAPTSATPPGSPSPGSSTPGAPAGLASALSVPGPGPFHFGSDARTWPDVCGTISIAELQILNPQITGLNGAPQGTKATVIGGGGGMTPNNTQCDFDVDTAVNPASSGEPSDVALGVTANTPDQPAEYKSNHAEQQQGATANPGTYADYPGLPGGTDCYYDGSMLNCLHGNYLFTVGGTAYANSAPDPTWVAKTLLPLAVKLGSELQ